MLKYQKINFKTGDIVIITSGYHKSQIGEIIKTNKKKGTVLIKGINFKFKHIKPKTENAIGEIKKIVAPIHHSNVKLYN